MSFTFDSEVSISKESIYEDLSFSDAFFEDATNRSITNECIEKGNTVLELYDVISDAISGGMGSVWKVHHKNWDTDLAMKRPKPYFFAEAGTKRKELFVKECVNWINLGLHPNIVSCYYVREVGGVPSVFSEWMDGGSLCDSIQTGRLYDGTSEMVEARMLDMAIQMAYGLDYSHSHSLLHRDVKPGNILLSQDYEAKLSDFGLAEAVSAEEGGEISTGYTSQYCPPEQMEGKPAEPWMDIYAYALTVLEMYSGERCWNVGADVAKAPESYLNSTRVRMPRGVKEIILGCVNRQFTDFTDIISQLTDIYREVTGRAYPRLRPEEAKAEADTLNNRALSFLDLKKPEAAAECFRLALSADSGNVRAVYNDALFRYRYGFDDDISCVESLKALLADTNDPDCERAFRYISEETGRSRELKKVFSRNSEYEGPVEITPDGSKLLFHNPNNFEKAESVIVHDLETEQDLFEISRMNRGEPAEMMTGFSADGAHLFGRFMKDDYLYKWSLEDGSLEASLRMSKLPGEQIAAYRSDTSAENVLCASQYGRMVIWHSLDGSGRTIGISEGRIHIDLSGDGKLVLVSNQSDSDVHIFNVDTSETEEIPLPEAITACFACGDSCILIISGFGGGTISLYDIAQKQMVYSVPFHQIGEYTRLMCQYVISSDGNRILLETIEGFVLFDIPTHRFLYTLSADKIGKASQLVHKGFISPDGTIVYLSWYGGYIEGFEFPTFDETSPWMLSRIHTTLQNLEEDALFAQHMEKAEAALAAGNINLALVEGRSCAEIADGKYRSSDSYIDFMRRFSANLTIDSFGTPILRRNSRVLRHSVNYISESCDGKWLACISEKGDLVIIDNSTGETVYSDTFRKYSHTSGVHFAGNQMYVLILGSAGGIADGIKKDMKLEDSFGGIFGMTFEGRTLTSESETGSIYSFDMDLLASDLQKAVKVFESAKPVIRTDTLVDFCISPDHETFICRHADGNIYSYTLSGEKQFLLNTGEYQFACSEMSPDGKSVLILSTDVINFAKRDKPSSSNLQFIDPKSGRILMQYDRSSIAVYGCYSTSGNYAVVGTTLFSLRDRKAYEMNISGCTGTAFAGDRFLIFAGSEDIDVYDLLKQKMVLHTKLAINPSFVACSRDGCILYIGGDNGELLEYYLDYSYVTD